MNVHFVATLPAPFSFAGWDASQGSGTYDITSHVLDFTFDSMGGGSTASVIMTLSHDGSTSGRFQLAADNSITWEDADRVDHSSNFVDPTILVTSCPDTTAPVTTATAVAGGTTVYDLAAPGWVNQPVTVTLTGMDEELGSGLANTFYILDGGSTQTYSAPIVINTDKDHVLTFWSVDNSNNEETHQTVHVMVDTTPPTVTYSGNQDTYGVDQTVNITCASADNLSGVASDTCQDATGPAYSFAVGQNSLSASATDNAGNVGAGSTSFTVVDSTTSLCNLTRQFDSNTFSAIALCTTLNAINTVSAAGLSFLKTFFVNMFVVQVNLDRTLTPQQKSTLIDLVHAL